MVAGRKPLTPKRKNGVFALMIAFFILQAGIDLAHSVTAFPFVHYGMFSERFPAKDSLAGYEVIADGQPLHAGDFGIYRWDMVQQPLLAFDKLEQTGDFSADKSRIRAAIPAFYTIISTNMNNRTGLSTRFPGWYRQYLGRLLGRTVRRVRIDKVVYGYDGARFTRLATQPWINCD